MDIESDGQLAFDEGMKYYNDKDFEKAIIFFDKSIEYGFKGDVYQFRADCYAECGFLDLAMKDYEIAISLRPFDCNIYFMRSFIQSKLCNYPYPARYDRSQVISWSRGPLSIILYDPVSVFTTCYSWFAHKLLIRKAG